MIERKMSALRRSASNRSPMVTARRTWGASEDNQVDIPGRDLAPVLVGHHHQRAGARRLLHQRHPEEIVETVGLHPLAHDAAFEPVLPGVRALQRIDAIDGEGHVDIHLRHGLEKRHLASHSRAAAAQGWRDRRRIPKTGQSCLMCRRPPAWQAGQVANRQMASSVDGQRSTSAIES